MDLSGISLTLMIGPQIPVPAPRPVTEALDKVTVTHADGSPSGFQLELKADRTSAFLRDYPLLIDRLLAAGNRVVIVVNVGARPHVLMDGLIARVELPRRQGSGAATLGVTGQEISVEMGRTGVTAEYPGLGHPEIVALVLAKYMSYGVVPRIIPPSSSLASDPLEKVPQQNATDLCYLKYLAGLHGNVFFVQPGPAPLFSTAYWGPPPRIGAPLPALTVDMGPATNVDTIDFGYDSQAPTLFKGIDQDAESEKDVPISTSTSLRIPLAREPALQFSPRLVNTRIVNTPGMTTAAAMAYTQGMTDRSTDHVVTASGDVDTLRYGSIMKVASLIGVRGCGSSLDGLYTINEVTHTLSRGEYRQHFALAREGLMSTIPVVRP
ncbi:MAG: hypothetical protein ABSG76_24565 [Xanthobacteraceae bacterium]|jgi:hypothetical protein